MSLAIHPSDSIRFNRPFTKKQKGCILTLTNNNVQAVAFKAKTNAAKLYTVRPNSGTIEAGERINVVITKLIMEKDPPLDEPCTDKFLFESSTISKGDSSSKLDASFWDKRKKKNKVHSHKIPIEFLPEVDLASGELVRIHPSTTLTFWGPFTEEAETTLTIDNIGLEPVAFKVRTTNIKDFCVQPNMGKIDALEEHPVLIIRLKHKNELTAEEIKARCHKFQILVTPIPPGRHQLTVDELFAWADSNPEHKVYGHRLIVRYPDQMGLDDDDTLIGSQDFKDTTSKASSSHVGLNASFIDDQNADEGDKRYSWLTGTFRKLTR
ncbi:hypothetical protein ONZ45_g8910 [Pleurotus djamor]|nr:hypothetical protein ONZ45_g8910 [Pleurotus djamor]